MNPGSTARDRAFVVLAEDALEAEPAKDSLDHPAPWQQDEPATFLRDAEPPPRRSKRAPLPNRPSVHDSHCRSRNRHDPTVYINPRSETVN